MIYYVIKKQFKNKQNFQTESYLLLKVAIWET